MNNSQSLKVISIPPDNGQPPTHLMIFLHGWGADARDLIPIASFLDLPDYQFLFPNAPFPHPQVAGGRAWYALETNDYNGLSESQELLRAWLLSLEEQTGIPLAKTFLSGFSQGGAMVLDVGLTLPLAGLCSLSGYLHSAPEVTATPIPPVFIAHGRKDTVVPIEAAQQAREILTAWDVKVEYHEFDMGHEIPLPVLSELREFLLAHSN
ncbi:serine esterase [Aphanothece hegewaldii CCALA 016]|uniref:Serine esterase n=1 Tax=Aphanothece hegewaldii CCALA 016 TaxID=2107694 RepID=A0A2T1M3D1_9CHRO|nr:alpha/beta hydrolase [Aphanothece hegewaldii]PSF39353.1 serine esterase [Aphanothece hegewaldii CCALA 016]